MRFPQCCQCSLRTLSSPALNLTTGSLQDSGPNQASEGIMGAHSSNLDDLMEEDMHHWYTKFMRESPSGLITLFELKTMLEMGGMTEEASSYVDQVFFTFDMDGVGKQCSFLFSSSFFVRKIIV